MKKTEFNFSEKQGRLVIQINCFLEMDLDNEELQKVFEEMNIGIEHPLISDYTTEPVIK